MTQIDLDSIWNYYLSIETDLASTSQFIEPRGQENVFSFEFFKILILSCTEVEAVFKDLCMEKTGKKGGNISEYKETILTHFPRIIYAKVYISRWGKAIFPFEGWDSGKLKWWDAYNAIKHNRNDNFHDATYQNAVYALSALYILILYLSKTTRLELNDTGSKYIFSEYTYKLFAGAPDRKLPDFETQKSKNLTERIDRTTRVYYGSDEPENPNNGDIWFKTLD